MHKISKTSLIDNQNFTIIKKDPVVIQIINIRENFVIRIPDNEDKYFSLLTEKIESYTGTVTIEAEQKDYTGGYFMYGYYNFEKVFVSNPNVNIIVNGKKKWFGCEK